MLNRALYDFEGAFMNKSSVNSQGGVAVDTEEKIVRISDASLA